MKNRQKIIFVVGTARSGTTLLQRLFSERFFVSTTAETHFFRLLARKNLFGFFLPFLCNEINTAIIEICPSHIKKKAPISAKRYKEIFYSAIDKNLQMKNCAVFLEKTPSHLWYIEEIKKSSIANGFDPYFLHIYRSRFENVRSLYSVTRNYPQWGGARSLQKCVLRWENDVKIHHRFILCDNHIIVSYGSLLSNTEKVMYEIEAIWKFLTPAQSTKIDNIFSSAEPWKINTFKKIGSRFEYDFFSELEFRNIFPIHNELKLKIKDIEDHAI